MQALFDDKLYKTRLARVVRSGKHRPLIDNELISITQDILSHRTHPFKRALIYSPLGVFPPVEAQEIKHFSFLHDGIIESEMPLATGEFDFILSLASMQSVNDIPGLLRKYYNALQKGGMLMVFMLGGMTLVQLRGSIVKTDMAMLGGYQAKTIPMVDIKDLGLLASSVGFSSPVISSESIEVYYDKLIKLLHDLRYMGLTNILQSRQDFLPKNYFEKLEENYRIAYAQKNSYLPATFETLMLTAIKKQ
jgi:SAM-dependent methyltransferase